MKRSSTLLQAFLLAIVFGACHTVDPYNATNTLARVGTVEFHLVEQASDADYYIPRSKSYEIDSRSTLAVFFAVEPIDAAPADPEWRMINDWLQAVSDLADQRLVLDSEAVDLTHRQEIASFQDRVGAFDDAVDEAVDKGMELMKAALPDQQDRHDVRDSGETELTGIAHWMRDRLRFLRRRGSDRSSVDQRVQIAVLAFRQPVEGAAERLHVENYDTIAAALSIETENWALGLTDKELAKLRMEIMQSEHAAEAIRGIKTRLNELGGLQQQIAAKIRDLLERIQEESQDDIDGVDQAIDTALGVVKKLQGANDSTSPVGMMISNLEKLKGVDPLRRKWLNLFGEFKNLLGSGDVEDLNSFLMGPTGLVNTIQSLAKSTSELIKEWNSLRDAARDVASDLALVFQGQYLIDFKAALPDELRGEIDLYLETIEPFVKVLEELIGNFKKSGEVSGILADYSEDAGLTIPRDLYNLLPGSVSLDGVADPGDTIVIRVELRDQDKRETTQTVEYRLKVRNQGWYDELSGQAILTRGDSGGNDATSWQPNVAALMSWRHHERFPNGFEKFMNFLDPAIGVHAASLDQGANSVEFGLGANLMFFDGLLFFGAGYNLNVDDDHLYYFVGTDLFKLLGSLSPSVD